MVKKALLVAGVTFVLYTLFIHRIKPHWNISQPRGHQKNQLKAEKYLYNSQHESGVLVGSSLAAHLDTMPGTYNLSLSGMSPLDGLALVIKQKHLPRMVLVEMNFIDREEDPDFTALLTNPVLMPAKRLLLSLRANKQPLAVVDEQLQVVLAQLSYRFTAPADGSPRSEQISFLDQMMVKQRKRYAQPPVATLLQRQLDKLRQIVTLLEQRNVQVIFYEMPVDQRLCHTPRVKAIRRAFQQHFPPSVYFYVYPPTCAGYHTTDGLHLDGPSATRYTNFLQHQLARRQY